MADDLVPQLINLLGNKALIAQQQPAWSPQDVRFGPGAQQNQLPWTSAADPWGNTPPIQEQNLGPGMPFMPPVPPPPMQQMQQPMQNGQPNIPVPQGGGLVDQITRFMMHPLTQGAIGAIGGGLSGGRGGRMNAGQRIGNAFLGGLGGAEAATRTQLYQQQVQSQAEHTKQLEKQRQDELVARREQAAATAKHQERQEQIQGFQTPEQVKAFQEQLSGTEDPLLIQAMKMVPKDSPTYRKDLQDTYKVLADRDNKQDALAVKEQYGNALLEQKRLIEDTKAELSRERTSAMVQNKLLSIDVALMRVNAQITQNAQQLALEREKMTNTNLRAAEGLVTKFATSTQVLLEQNPTRRQEMIQNYRNDLYGSFGIPVQPATPPPGTTPAFPVTPGSPLTPGPKSAGASEGPPAQPPPPTHRFNPATGRAEPIGK